MFRWLSSTALGSRSLPLVKSTTAGSSSLAAGRPRRRTAVGRRALSAAEALSRTVSSAMRSSRKSIPGTGGQSSFRSSFREVMMVRKPHFCWA